MTATTQAADPQQHASAEPLAAAVVAVAQVDESTSSLICNADLMLDEAAVTPSPITENGIASSPDHSTPTSPEISNVPEEPHCSASMTEPFNADDYQQDTNEVTNGAGPSPYEPSSASMTTSGIGPRQDSNNDFDEFVDDSRSASLNSDDPIDSSAAGSADYEQNNNVYAQNATSDNDDESQEQHNQPASSNEEAVPNRTSKAGPMTNASDIIELLDSDDDEAGADDTSMNKKRRFHQVAGSALAQHMPSTGAVASYHARAANLPEWMKQGITSNGHAGTYHPLPPLPPRHPGQPLIVGYQGGDQKPSLPGPNPPASFPALNTPAYLPLPPQFKPNWLQLLPSPQRKSAPSEPGSGLQGKVYQLSLLNVNEFTIEGLSPRHDMKPSSVSGLRVPIRQISRKHGKSVYERDKDGGGKWRIPLGAYHDFVGFLRSEATTQVFGIPANQLQIASLERARQEKGYPTPDELVEHGVPKGLANKLAPFQRGGVDFVREKGGRALIADGT
jgi:hypothetical protein